MREQKSLRQQLEFSVTTALVVSALYYCFFVYLGAASFHKDAHMLAIFPTVLVCIIGLSIGFIAYRWRQGVIAAVASSVLAIFVGMCFSILAASGLEALIREIVALQLGFVEPEKDWLVISGLSEFVRLIVIVGWPLSSLVSLVLALLLLKFTRWFGRRSHSPTAPS